MVELGFKQKQSGSRVCPVMDTVKQINKQKPDKETMYWLDGASSLFKGYPLICRFSWLWLLGFVFFSILLSSSPCARGKQGKGETGNSNPSLSIIMRHSSKCQAENNRLICVILSSSTSNSLNSRRWHVEVFGNPIISEALLFPDFICIIFISNEGWWPTTTFSQL